MMHIMTFTADEVKALEMLYMALDGKEAIEWPDSIQDAMLSAGAKLLRANTLQVAGESQGAKYAS